MSNRTDRERYAFYAKWLDSDDPAVRANTLICLIHQTNFLLDKYIQALEENFIKEGGYSEQLATARLAERARYKQDGSDAPDGSDEIPKCPVCGAAMSLRTAQKGKNAGKQFWGCTAYPDCRGLIDL